jgi:pimeloyl-ACP methyl ester carboxylesterase
MSISMSTKSVVFIHGLWLHAESWNTWIEFFCANGYEAMAASWPGDAETTEATRRNAKAVAGYGVTEIADHIAKQIKKFEQKPILIGHSFGGLLAQNLLGRNLAAAAIAIDPAPIKGVPELPFSVLKSGFPVLGNPLNYGRAVSLTEPQFRYGFTNAITETFNPRSATKVNDSNASRGPLLFISGAEDHTVPPVLVKSAVKRYRNSRAVTEYKEFPKRGHSLTIDHGWKEIAQYCQTWLKSKGF